MHLLSGFVYVEQECLVENIVEEIWCSVTILVGGYLVNKILIPQNIMLQKSQIRCSVEYVKNDTGSTVQYFFTIQVNLMIEK